MEKDIITYCLIALLGLLFSIVMYLLMKYKSSKSSQKSKQIVKITFIFVILIQEQYLASKNHHTATACCLDHCNSSCRLVCLLDWL